MTSEITHHEESSNPRIDLLRAEVASGKTVHEAIGTLLSQDGNGLYDYYQQHLEETVNGETSQPLDPQVIDLYGLRSEGNPDLLLENSLHFVSGFNYLVAHIYPTLVRAVHPEPEQQLDLTLGGLALLANLSEETQREIRQELQASFEKEGFSMEETRRSLASDLSGASWLRQQARQLLGDGTLELFGAYKAIEGMGKLFELLNRETTQNPNPQ